MPDTTRTIHFTSKVKLSPYVLAYQLPGGMNDLALFNQRGMMDFVNEEVALPTQQKWLETPILNDVLTTHNAS
ncbi:MAG: hypothetical protein K6T83_15835 [Alicyclobacillus sp.]|uniref:hypothetical protein n=1 Tax=Alicyclobacillus herbarius TaxID=122960 RepID=UPI000422F8C5|nr:hypothetical protein [Alicyclobacillus herbarius]MCL6444899.1 hypothetical protein [Alicyclobacillus sp.]